MGAVVDLLDLRALLELRTASPADLDSDTVLIRCDVPGTMQLFRTTVRGGELEQLTDFQDPVEGRFVPGTERVLVEHDEAGNEHTQLSLLEGGRLEQLVSDPSFVHRDPHFSADGSLLAYATNRDNGVDWVVYVRSLRDGRERAIFARGGVFAIGGGQGRGRPCASAEVLGRTGRSSRDEGRGSIVDWPPVRAAWYG